MPTIIIATDFSEVATNAAHYACSMGQELHMPVILLHSYIIPVTFQDNPMPVISLEESKKLALEQIEELTNELKKAYPALDLEGHVAYGDITDSLKEVIPQYNAWMVVVGNSISNDSGFWLGSNLLSTLRNLQCPVLAVPAGYPYKKVEQIAFACDLKHVSENLPADDLVTVVNKVGGALHVLNVDHENKNFDADTPYEYARLNDSLATAHPEYHNIDNEDVEEGIQSFMRTRVIDWLVVVPHKHNFFESLFHKSQTKAVVRNAQIPILALHEKG